MTLSSAEKNSGINPWVFPDVKEDIIFPEFQEQVSSSRPSDKYRSEAQSQYSPPIHQTSIVEAGESIIIVESDLLCSLPILGLLICGRIQNKQSHWDQLIF